MPRSYQRRRSARAGSLAGPAGACTRVDLRSRRRSLGSSTASMAATDFPSRAIFASRCVGWRVRENVLRAPRGRRWIDRRSPDLEGGPRIIVFIGVLLSIQDCWPRLRVAALLAPPLWLSTHLGGWAHGARGFLTRLDDNAEESPGALVRLTRITDRRCCL